MSIKVRGPDLIKTNTDNGYVMEGTVNGASTTQSVFRSRVNIASGVTLPTTKIVSAFEAGAEDLSGTHTGKASVFHVETPTAGTFDALAILDGYSTGCASLVTITLDSITVGTVKALAKIRIGTDDLLIPCLSTITHA